MVEMDENNFLIYLKFREKWMKWLVKLPSPKKRQEKQW